MKPRIFLLLSLTAASLCCAASLARRSTLASDQQPRGSFAQAPCDGKNLVLTGIATADGVHKEGYFDQADLYGTAVTIPETSNVCLNPFAYIGSVPGHSLKLGDTSYVSVDFSGDFVFKGNIAIGDGSSISIAANGGWIQGSNEFPDFIDEFASNVDIGSNCKVQVMNYAHVWFNGDVVLHDNTVVILDTHARLALGPSGEIDFGDGTNLTILEGSNFNIGDYSTLQTVPMSGAVTISVGAFARLTIPDHITCLVIGNVSIPSFTDQIWDPQTTSDAVKCATKQSEAEAALLAKFAKNHERIGSTAQGERLGVPGKAER